MTAASETHVPHLDPSFVEDYWRDGAVCLRGVFTEWVPLLAEGVAANMAAPGPYGSENTKEVEPGRFFDDYCNWERIPQFRQFVLESDAARIAAEIMKSQTAQFFHDHVLVKEPHTEKETPWHQDIPYYCVEGDQSVSFWMPLDPVSEAASIRVIRGSHLWERLVRPVKWLTDADFYGSDDHYMDLPDIAGRPDDYDVMTWSLEPGDAIAFSFKTVHAASGNLTGNRRRAFSHRWVGDDARFVERKGRTSPPYPGIGQKSGERLREDWFPVLWPR
jgi:ectoine hydroxylase-related dioxygenase (phytanoyl-CoA dioxygenase family)